MKTDEFDALVREIGRGSDVDQEELAEALSYAGTAWYEIQQLTKSLCSGYRSLQKDIERKDRKIEMANKMMAAVRAENERLREEVRVLRETKAPDGAGAIVPSGMITPYGKAAENG